MGNAIATITFALLFILVLVLVMAWPTQICWNATMPYLFGLKEISFVQAIALNCLASILFKSTTTIENKD
jgi:hypothetical protein